MSSITSNMGLTSEAIHRTTVADAVSCVRELVATPSVSGEEVPACGVFMRYAQRWGFATHLDEVGNALAVRETPALAGQQMREIILLGHIDTVHGEIPVRIEGDWLHGRGSVDAKGPLAAMLVAAARATLPAGVRLVVAAAVGEETAASPGAAHLARTRSPDACIIGEPSGWDGVTLGYKGTLRVLAHVERGCGHSAGPHASSADTIHAFWHAAQSLLVTLTARTASRRIFDRVQCTIREMRSESDGLREWATLTGSVRLPPDLSPAHVEMLLQQVASTVGVTLRCEGHTAAHASDRNDLVVRAIWAAIRDSGTRPRPILKTGTSDMNVVAPHWRCPIAAYGPGDSELDHTPHEKLSLSEYLRSIEVLGMAIRTLAHQVIAADEPPVAIGA